LLTAVALDHVPQDHLDHLLKAALSDKKVRVDEALVWFKKLRSKVAAERDEALAFIEKWEPGTLQRLDETWAFFAHRAVHLWTLPCFEDEDVAGVLSRHKDVAASNGELVDYKKRFRKTAENARVRRVRVEDNELIVIVYLTRTLTWEYEDEPQHDERTQRVTVRLTFGDALPLAEVYASSVAARLAVFAVLDWLRGSSTPRDKSAEQAEILQPVTFTEAQIVRFATKVKLEEPTVVDGDDPTRQVGGIKFTGKKVGTVRAPLDRKHQKVAAQLDHAKNATRTYAVPFKHVDGYKERPEASFHFKGVPHVTMTTRASRPAIDWLIGELRASLGV
jgi:hypothetical protein